MTEPNERDAAPSVDEGLRQTTPSENLLILAARLSERLSPAEIRELNEAAAALSTRAGKSGDGDALDARRYRWLRDNATHYDEDDFVREGIDEWTFPHLQRRDFQDQDPVSLDAAIDAALASTPQADKGGTEK